MTTALSDFVAAYCFLGMAGCACICISISAYQRPTPLRLFCLINNVMTIAQASCTLAFCYELAPVRAVCILFFICRLGYVTLTAYELLKIGNRIQKNRSSLTRAALFWILAPILVIIYWRHCSSLASFSHDLTLSIHRFYTSSQILLLSYYQQSAQLVTHLSGKPTVGVSNVIEPKVLFSRVGYG